MHDLIRTRWAAIGAAVAVTLGAGGLSLTQAAEPTNGGPVYVALSQPCRVVDTRPAPDNVGIAPGKISAGETNAITVTITGDNGNCTGIPTEAVGVAINLTAINNSTRSHFRVYPAGASLPLTANLNFGPGQTPLANKVDVGLSAGKIKLYNHAGTVDAAIDIFGYYINHNHDDLYYRKTDTYSKTEVDTAVAALPKTYFATVAPADATATIVRGVGATAVTRITDGYYKVDFTADVSGCTWLATYGPADSNGVDAKWATVKSNNTNEVRVVIRDSNGAQVDGDGFHLAALCP